MGGEAVFPYFHSIDGMLGTDFLKGWALPRSDTPAGRLAALSLKTCHCSGVQVSNKVSAARRSPLVAILINAHGPFGHCHPVPAEWSRGVSGSGGAERDGHCPLR